MLVAAGAFAVMDTALKILTEHYPTMQVSAMRGFASLPIILLPLIVKGRLNDLKPVRWKLHLMRGVLSVFMLSAFVYALRVLSLADAYAIYLSAPLIITALSMPVLVERVGWHRWLAIGVGMCGVLVMLRPTGSSITTLGAVAAFVSAVAYAVSALSVRILMRTDTHASVVFWSLAIMTLVSTAIALPTWEAIRLEHVGWILMAGAFGALAIHLITRAFHLAPPSVVAPFEYTALLWGAGVDWLVWNTLPHARLYVGGGIVIASGLYVIWRESRRKPAQGVADAISITS